eukprot:5830143-Pleurochrysis_carterae.AAC.2
MHSATVEGLQQLVPGKGGESQPLPTPLLLLAVWGKGPAGNGTRPPPQRDACLVASARFGAHAVPFWRTRCAGLACCDSFLETEACDGFEGAYPHVAVFAFLRARARSGLCSF